MSSDERGRRPADDVDDSGAEFGSHAGVSDGADVTALADPDVTGLATTDPDAVPVSSPHDLARSALNRAQAGARARGLRPGQPSARGAAARAATAASAAGSGARPSRRDPAPIGDSLNALVVEHGWRKEISVGGVVGRWREVVGNEMADHCTPETFEDGVLVVRTDSTSWAAQLKHLVPQLLGRLAADIGPDVVRQVRVLGPVGPGWRRGPRTIPGRGPRDTYG